MVTITPTQAQYDQLTDAQKSYFEHLAGDAEHSNVLDFFVKVPAELRDNPEHVELYLNGGTVSKEVWIHDRGRAGGHYETVDFEMRDRDWSHDISKANGGSNEATNGRFEEASDNRSRGARNTTEAEMNEASAEDEEDVQTILEHAEELGDALGMGVAAEVASGFMEVAADGLAPLIGSAFVANKVANQFTKTQDKIGFGAIGAGAAAAVLCTPVGQAGVALWFGGRLIHRGVRIWRKAQK